MRTATRCRAPQTRLSGKLVYHRIGGADVLNVSPAPPRSLLNKLKLAAHAHQQWLHGELLRRYDYACVDSVQALRQSERAITAQGQIKHGRSRHEKDDRHEVGDRRHWVMGFDNRDKLILYKDETATLAQQIAETDRAIAAIQAERSQALLASLCRQYALLADADEVEFAASVTCRSGCRRTRDRTCLRASCPWPGWTASGWKPVPACSATGCAHWPRCRAIRISGKPAACAVSNRASGKSCGQRLAGASNARGGLDGAIICIWSIRGDCGLDRSGPVGDSMLLVKRSGARAPRIPHANRGATDFVGATSVAMLFVAALEQEHRG
ncbi:MAG: hypothetical protein M3Y93_09260 [Pseudomonadota bacterium]|nr:hypothetical protein [Pseudomonadota bacterium]